MRIAYNLYELCFKTYRKGKRSFRRGALLRVTFDDHLIGYADCHPWLEFNDLTLPQQLTLLKEGRTTPLTQRSLYFARLDAEARHEKKNLFEGLRIPQSHYLIMNFSQETKQELEQLIKENFTRFKIKIGNNNIHDIPKLILFLQWLPNGDFKLRLDFNFQLDRPAFEDLLNQIEPFKERIEFYEDPFPYDQMQWEEIQNKYHIALALDTLSKDLLVPSSSASYRVIKPAVQQEQLILQTTGDQKYVFTSYLDHPFGQVTAAYVAAKTEEKIPGRVEQCGLYSHCVYEPNAFSRFLATSGPMLKPPPGLGFGFDPLLKGIDWQEL